jgi:hypothetical protein
MAAPSAHLAVWRGAALALVARCGGSRHGWTSVAASTDVLATGMGVRLGEVRQAADGGAHDPYEEANGDDPSE